MPFLDKALNLINRYFKEFLNKDYYEHVKEFSLILDSVFKKQVGNSIVFNYIDTTFDDNLLSISNPYINSIPIEIAYLKDDDLRKIIVDEVEYFHRAESEEEVFQIWKNDFRRFHKIQSSSVN